MECRVPTSVSWVYQSRSASMSGRACCIHQGSESGVSRRTSTHADKRSLTDILCVLRTCDTVTGSSSVLAASAVRVMVAHLQTVQMGHTPPCMDHAAKPGVHTYQGRPVSSCADVSSAWKAALKMFQPESVQAASSASCSAKRVTSKICAGSTPAGPESSSWAGSRLLLAPGSPTHRDASVRAAHA